MLVLKKTLPIILCFITCFTFCACKQDTKLDLSTYCHQKVAYALYNSSAAQEIELEELTSPDGNYNQYRVIKINTDKTWTYGLFVEKIEFDVKMSEDIYFDLDITITNLEHAENLRRNDDTKYYYKTLSINPDNSHVKLDINDTLINADCEISIEVVTSCYEENPNFTFAIANFAIFGYHEQTNY